MAVNEEVLLRQHKKSRSHEDLRTLLIAHQNRIYNACCQVLGRAEDAEDAAQEALLKLATGAASASDADAVRGWIYRVSIGLSSRWLAYARGASESLLAADEVK